MCAHGLFAKDEFGEGLVYKPSRMLTNSSAIAELVGLRCCGGHRHVHLVSGQAEAATEYPNAFCDRIIDGALIEQKRRQENSAAFIGALMTSSGALECDMCDPADGIDKMLSYVDSRTGEQLQDELVSRARRDEMKIFSEMQVYRYASEREFQETPGAKVIGTTWVDTNKGSTVAPCYKSRLCGQEFAKGDPMDDLFAATPPLQGVKLMISICASEPDKCLMVLDVKRAFLYGKAVRPLFTKLPKEDPKYGTPGLLWKLEKAMYGTRDAPAIWQREVKRTLASLGFESSRHNPCVFRHEKRDILLNVHVDDFLCLGVRKQLDWLHEGLGREYLLKREILGPGRDEARAVGFLGREIRWTSEGLEYEPDPKHVQILLSEWQLEGCREVVSPGVKEVEVVEEDDLPPTGANAYRRAVARLNYLAQDRMDIAYATKELARTMSAPKPGCVVKLKRMLRYLKGRPRCHVVMHWQTMPKEIVAYVDSDWAGCLRTRRSTSGGVLMLGRHCVGHWSRTQANVALSSGEAELNASLKGGVELKGAQILLAEMRRVKSARLKGDSAACTGILSREGAGKMKHVQVKQFWLQESVRDGTLIVQQIPRESNSADAFTKHWGPDVSAHFSRVCLRVC